MASSYKKQTKRNLSESDSFESDSLKSLEILAKETFLLRWTAGGRQKTHWKWKSSLQQNVENLPYNKKLNASKGVIRSKELELATEE